MWFFEAKNAIAVCVYCAIMELSEVYFMLNGIGGMSDTDRRIHEMYAVTSIIITAVWLAAALMLWKKQNMPKINAFGHFTAIFGVTILLEVWEPLYDLFTEGWEMKYTFTILEIISCLQLLGVTACIQLGRFRVILRVRLLFIFILLYIITGRTIAFYGMDFDIGDYIDGVSTILVFTFTLISLFDEDIKAGLDRMLLKERPLKRRMGPGSDRRIHTEA